MESEISEWPVHGDRLMSRRSAQHTPSSDIFGSHETFYRPQTEETSRTHFKRASGIITPQDQEDFIGAQDFYREASFESSEEESPATGKETLIFPESTANARNASDSGSSEIDGLDVSDEIKGLFQYIGHYKPRDLEIGTVLKPFIPDYIPAVGAVDEFIKVPRPDGLPDYLGLKVLDESGPRQSDPAVISLQLRAASLQSSLQPLEVASIENPEKNTQKIDAWIESVKDLHRAKPPPLVTYSKPMPDIKKLMQVQKSGGVLALYVHSVPRVEKQLTAF